MLRNVLEYLENAAQFHPHKPAFADDRETLTYKELSDTARQIAGFLLRNRPFPTQKPIAVFCDRSIRSLAAFLGVVYTGNFYVPIDAALPEKRIRSMLHTLQPAAILCAADLPQSMPAVSCPIFHYETLLSADKGANAAELDKRRRAALDTDPLYAIFTSGSTGVPKAVLVSHRSVIDLADQFTETFHFDETSVFGNQAPFDFDISVKDIYCTLKNHGTLYIIPKVLFASPAGLTAYLNERKINTLIWAVSALRILENLKAFRLEHPAFVRTVLFSGEVLSCKVLNYWRRYLPDALFVNVYGPTEITCNCTYYKITQDYPNDGVLPIGKPFANTGVFLLNEDQENPACGESGEICVKGSCLALGYYADPQKTAESFCQNPLQPFYPERIYRTGDLGRMDADGNLYYLSRRDHQIKHMGHRIELGELEAAANALPYIQASCCIYDTTTQKILMFYQASSPCDTELLQALLQKLPKYMCPNKFIWSTGLPLNKNGKIDRQQLQNSLHTGHTKNGGN